MSGGAADLGACLFLFLVYSNEGSDVVETSAAALMRPDRSRIR